MTYVKSLADRAKDEYVHQNASWIKQIFKSYGAFSMSLRSDHSDVGHQYHFTNAVLNTRIGEWTKSTFSGKTCGENGGKTAKGLPCKKKATVDGRCPLHPPPLFTVRYNVGDAIESITIDFGDDTHLRPLPATVEWSKIRFKVPGTDARLSAIDQRSGSVYLTSGTRVWDDIILDVKETLNLPPEAHVRINKQLYGADPLWTVEKLLLVLNLPLITQMVINERKVEVGYLLSDYGLQSGGCLDLVILC